MARSLWTGSLSFGLVNVPVALFSAARDLDVHFHQLHDPDGSRIEVRRFCGKEDVEVALDDIGHGYELESGKQVVLTDDDLVAVAPRRTRTIDIQSFVDGGEIDPVLFDHPYWLVPTGESEGPRRAYRLLVDAMGEHDDVALGRFVLRTKEYLVAVRVRDGLLALSTMLFADEVRPTKGMGPGGRKPAKAAVDEAVKLIEALSAEFDPGDYVDEHRKRLRAIVKDKQKGGTVQAPEQDAEPSVAGDLMEALRRTMDELGSTGKRSGAQGKGTKQKGPKAKDGKAGAKEPKAKRSKSRR
jgi:DNA end-binding protein Ku